MAPSPIRVRKMKHAPTPIFETGLVIPFFGLARFGLQIAQAAADWGIENRRVVRLRFRSRVCVLLGLRLGIGSARLSALAAGFGGERTVLRKAALFGRHGFAALASCLRGKAVILGKASLFRRHALSALAGDRALFLRIHRSKPAIGLLSVDSCHGVSFPDILLQSGHLTAGARVAGR